MAQHNLRLEITDKWTLKPHCNHDRSLMKVSSESNISDFKLFHINCCRIYLQVLSVADISTADGTNIREEILSCMRIKDRKSPLVWPNQQEPTSQQKLYWKSALYKCLFQSKSSDSQYLKHRLGKGHMHSIKKWKFFYSPTTRKLWRQTISTWLIHNQVSSSQLSIQCQPVGYAPPRKLPFALAMSPKNGGFLPPQRDRHRGRSN